MKVSLIKITFNQEKLNYDYFRIQAPELPTWQDCHELWSKKRKRQMREQQEAMANLPPGKPALLGRDGKPFVKSEDGDFGG